MAADDPGNAARAPVVLRIKVRYEDPDAFVERFAPYVARAGLFLRSKQPKPVGTEVRFELRLADDRPVLVGMGIVRWSREPDPARPHQPPGMAIEFTRVTKESRGVILRMLELRRKLGLGDGPRGLPSPPDDDVGVATPSPSTATAVAPILPPPAESVRPRRPRPSELIASVTAPPTADAFDSDLDKADVSSVLTRARSLVAGDADRELAALLDAAAAPVEVTIEEASMRLSSLLGTSPVPRRPRRDDSVPTDSRPAYAPPPKIAAPIAADLVPATDPERTRVVNLDTLAAQTSPFVREPETRVVNLDALAAESAADPDERTRVRRATPSRPIAVPEAPADELDFDRPPSGRHQVPREFEAAAEPDTNVRKRPELPPPEPRPARRTQPPPPPPPRARKTQPPPVPVPARRPIAALDDRDSPDADEDALTPPPVDVPHDPPASSDPDGPTEIAPLDPPDSHGVTSSGSIDLSGLIHDLEAESGHRLGGEALDADGLIADLGAFERRRTPPESPFTDHDTPYPDLASFADPPSNIPRRSSPSIQTSAVRPADGDATRLHRPTARNLTPAPVVTVVPATSHDTTDDTTDDGADDDIDIEIDLDD